MRRHSAEALLRSGPGRSPGNSWWRSFSTARSQPWLPGPGLIRLTPDSDAPNIREGGAAREAAAMERPVPGSAPAHEEPNGVLPAAEQIRSGAHEAERQQSEGENDMADRFEGAPTVETKL
ncbi:hypothetical protein [Methylobacterium aquaticum]|uniref:Uncharacterized protein n=1 Tax=Methylobacterium aquaticum TaxID=270351 RepID=A0A0J6S3I3_9HYPH|nr:hypothetical protein [Methylobacterium aquaticum]KMO29750.1 hypothetical protein VP06_23760 [Methylobacterium aquaticum]